MNIDWTKPIEFFDGTPAFYKGVTNAGLYRVLPKGIPKDFEKSNHYRVDGTHFYSSFPAIRNVVPVQTDQELANKYRELRAEAFKAARELESKGYILRNNDGARLDYTAGPIVTIKKTIHEEISL